MKRSISATVIFSILSLLGFALAQTRDGTSITNTATATYTNAADQPLTTTSNTVTTTVLPIYRFAITPNGTDTANAGGATPNNITNGVVGGNVVFAYGLENQGNTTNNTINLATVQSTTDGFDFGATTIYRDNPNGGAGNVGVLDAGDFIVKAAGATTGSVTVPYGESVTLFVQAAIPTGTPNSSVGRLNLAGTSALGGQSDTDNWAEATVFTNATLTINKTATGNAVPGAPITYTLSGANTGGTNPYAVTGVAQISGGNAQNGILISDQIPAGLSYVPGSLTLSGTNTALASSIRLIYSVNGGTSWSLTPPANGINAVALLILGTPGSRITTNGGAPFSYGFTFRVTSAAGTPAGTVYSNTGSLRYDINGDSNGTDAGETASSVPATTTIDQTGTFAVGPYTFPNAGANGTYTVTGEGYTITRSGDTQTIATVANERQVSFRQSLQNATNFNDTFTLSSTLAGLPVGSVSFYAVNGDGSRGALITAPLAVAAGATADFYTVITLPADYTTTTPIDFVVTATATTNTATTADSTTDTISAVTEAQAVDIGNYAGNGTPNDTLVNFPTQPGGTVNIPLIVRNDGADPDTFDFATAVAPNFPAGYVLTIYADDNCDNIVNGTDAAVTDSGPLAAGTFECFIARVTVPAGAAPVAYDVTVTATSRKDPKVSDSITDTVTVGLLQNFTFTPTLQAKATSATVPVVYTHTITNNSNDVASVNLSLTEPGTANWLYEYSLDGTNYTTTLPTGISVAANGGTQAVYVRVTPNTGATQGYVDDFTLTATPTYGATVGTSASVIDTTTIDQQFFGQLNLTKTVDKASAEPGDTLVYTIVTQNTGSGALTNVKVTDPLPANTSFVSVSASVSGGLVGQRILYSTNGTTWSQTPPATLAAGGSIYVGVSTNGDNTINASDTFPGTANTANPPGAGVLTVTFTVTIN